jgi:hypothetical protein
MRTVRTPNILPVHSVNVLDGMSIVYVFHILLGSKNFLIFYPFMYILVAYPEHPHGMRDANIPLYIPGISLGWRVLVGKQRFEFLPKEFFQSEHEFHTHQTLSLCKNTKSRLSLHRNLVASRKKHIL